MRTIHEHPAQAFKDSAAAAASVKKEARAAKKAADKAAGTTEKQGLGELASKVGKFARELKPAYWQVRERIIINSFFSQQIADRARAIRTVSPGRTYTCTRRQRWEHEGRRSYHEREHAMV